MQLFGLNSLWDEESWKSDSFLLNSSLYKLETGFISYGKIDNYDYVDYYRITLPSSGMYTITISNDSINSQNASWSDGYITANVVDSTGNALQGLDASAYQSLDGKIYLSWEGNYSTDYSLKLVTFGGADYAIKIENTYTNVAPVEQTITGTSSDDTLSGNDANDNIYGLGGRDSIYGNGGDDYLSGGGGDDSIEGGAGNDTIVGGDGIDAAVYLFESTGVVVNLAQGTATGAGSDTLSGIEWIYGSNYGDTLTGDDGDNAISGYAGNDFIYGGAGNDIINGGDGNDHIDGGAGVQDVAIFSSSVVVNLALGTATGNGNDTLIGIEGIIGSNSDDTLTGDNLANALMGQGGFDIIDGGGGDDRLNGGEGFDIIDGGEGYDFAQYTGNRDAYTIHCLDSGTKYTVTDNLGTDGSDALMNIEALVFADSTYYLDTTVPQVSSFSPTEGATGVDISDNIVLTFSESIQRGSGHILLQDSTGQTLETFSTSSDSQLAISGSTLTIDPTIDLDYSTDYKVIFSYGNIKDLSGNSYTGTSSYNFSTESQPEQVADSYTESHTLSVIVDQGIIDSDAILLKDLTEVFTFVDGELTDHSVVYAGSTFDYDQIDSLFTTVTRDGDFTEEFRAEIFDLAPSFSGITYTDAVNLLGVANIDGTILDVAGADGFYVA